MEESHHSYNDSKMYKNRKYGAVGSATGAGSSREHKVALTGLLREHTTEMESRELLKTAKGLNAGTSGEAHDRQDLDLVDTQSHEVDSQPPSVATNPRKHPCSSWGRSEATASLVLKHLQTYKSQREESGTKVPSTLYMQV